jgi:hypothetical protein
VRTKLTFASLTSQYVRTYKEGRRCRFKGCNVPLSVYNPEPYCFRHSSVMELKRIDKLARQTKEK